jgi:sec-independent protein translocase protein TatC
MFLNFVKELKNRSFLILIIWICLIIVCYIYKEVLLYIVVKPIYIKKYTLYLNANNLEFKKQTFYFISTNITEIFSTYFELILFVTNQITFFMIIYHLFCFITPALYSSEYFKLKLLIKFFFLTYFLTMIFLNKFFLPNFWNFLLNFQLNLDSVFTIYMENKIQEYLTFYINTFLYVFFIFFLFLFIFVIVNFFEDKKRFIKTSRRYFHFFFFLLSTLITPPDLLSQIFLALVFIVFYEFYLISLFLRYKLSI